VLKAANFYRRVLNASAQNDTIEGTREAHTSTAPHWN